MSSTARTHWQITRSVWMALFLREAMARLTATRFAWFWMLLEPLAFVVFFVAIRELMGRIRVLHNVEFIPWLIIGLVSFFLFRNGITRALGAISANRGLFAYRQVKPVDPLLVRAFLEGVLQTIVLLILLAGASLFGYDVIPGDPLGAMALWLAIWLLGFGCGLVASVAAELVPEIGKIINITMFPLFILSGAMFPVQMLPHSIQAYLLYNPVLHGVELIRVSFFNSYQTLSGISLLYLGSWILAAIALGLLLHVRFSIRLRAQ